MHLFELAIELGERSADMAAAAPALGFEGITPTSELTPEQVDAFRAKFAKAPVAAGPGGPAGGSPYQPPTWGPPSGAAPVAPVPSGGSGRSMGLGQMILITVAVVAVIGLFGFMIKNGGADQERLDRIANTPPPDAGEPELSPEEQAFADALAAQEKAKQSKQEPRDRERFCKAGKGWHAFDEQLASNVDRGDFPAAVTLIDDGYDLVLADLAEMEATIGTDHIPLVQQARAYEQGAMDFFRSGPLDQLRARIGELQAMDATPARDLAMYVDEHCVAPGT